MIEPNRLLAPNSSPMTLQGTNTWVVAPSDEKAVLIDPGPEVPDHLGAIDDACPLGVAEIWVTHRHHDHIQSAPGLARHYGAPLRTFDPALSTGRPLRQGETRSIGDSELEVLHIPGHTSDSVGFLMSGPERTDLFTGDMVLGEGTTVLMHPDGDLAAYLNSLRHMVGLVQERGVRHLLPGHGSKVSDPIGWLTYYADHRAERLQQVRAALAQGARTADEVVDLVYGEVNPSIRYAALASARAQLDFLERPTNATGAASARGREWSPSAAPAAASHVPRSRPGPC